MVPSETKQIFLLLCQQMDKLDKGEISPQQAYAMSKLVGRANDLLNYELRRAVLMNNPQFKKEFKNIETIQIGQG